MTTSYSEMINSVRSAFDSGKTRNVEFRRQQLLALRRMYINEEETFLAALKQDLNKGKFESVLTELSMLVGDIDYTLKRLDTWTKPEKVSGKVPLDKAFIHKEPFGVALVMGAWNYPLHLALLPVSGAIAAGNCVVLKPSEVSTATAQAIKETLPKYLDKECFKVVLGGIPETTELLKERFDIIFYTGAPQVGKIVRDAANKFLTPCVLELGGKSPAYVDSSVDMKVAMRRLLWGKCINAGQTCVAPDYLLCTPQLQNQVIENMKNTLTAWYGESSKNSSDLCKIVNERHFDRIKKHMKCGKIAIGGRSDRDSLWIEPTVLIDVKDDDSVMQEEIFGPILPIRTVNSLEEAITFIKKREKPLALYVFSNDNAVVERCTQQIPFGGATINDTMMHLANPELPFGGIGNSGTGHYHGKYSFDAFSHNKSVLKRNYNWLIESLGGVRYPPYSEKNLKKLLMANRDPQPSSKFFSFYLPLLIAFLAGGLAVYLGLS